MKPDTVHWLNSQYSGLTPFTFIHIHDPIHIHHNLSQVTTLPGWKLHPLRGDRKDEYSIAVTGNWRITFRLQGNTVTDVNFEDYH